MYGQHLSSTSAFETPLTKGMIYDISEVFDAYDSDRKGYLTRLEFKLAFMTLAGHKPSKFEKRELFPVEGSTMDKQEFMQLLSAKLRRVDDHDRIRQLFLAFDKDRKGYITVENLRDGVHEVLKFEKQQGKRSRLNLSPLALETLLTEFDTDRSNTHHLLRCNI